jgi:hypothetical protein
MDDPSEERLTLDERMGHCPSRRALASTTLDIALYLVLSLLWPFAAAGAVVFGLIWVLSSGHFRAPHDFER